MSQKYFELSLTAIICYCVLAIGVTSVMAKDKLRQEEQESAKKETTEKIDSDTQLDSTESKSSNADATKTKENKVAGQGESPQNKTDSVADEKKVDAKAEHKSNDKTAPVVRIGTSASTGSSSIRNIGDKSFDVVTPEWFDNPISEDAKYKLVKIDPFGLDDEMLNKEIKASIQAEIDEYVDEFLGAGAHKYVDFSPEEKNQVVYKSERVPGIYYRENQQEPVEFYYAHLKFDEAFRAKAKAKWVESYQQSRLIQFGLIAGGAFLLITFVFGGLKLNSATSGFYQGRLQFFVAIVILGVIAAGIYFGTKIDWI